MTAPPNAPPGSGLQAPGSGNQTKAPTFTPEPTTENPETSLDPRVRLLRDFFFNRMDAVAVRQKKRPPFPVWLPDGDPLKLLQAHVLGRKAPPAPVTRKLSKGGFTSFSGHFRVGSYAPALDGTTRWLCIDFDGAGHSHPLKDARGAAQATIQNFYAKKIPCYLERSGGGQGYHLWVFFEHPVPAADARTLGFQMVCRDAPLLKGGHANPERGQGIEIFPKQEKVSPKGYGNMVFLPWWSGAPGGANQFYPVTHEGLMGADPFIPEKFDTLQPEDLDWIIAEIRPEPSAAGHTFEGRPVESTEWKEWRRLALEKLPIEAIYGPWLAEREGPDSGPWLSCHSPLVADDKNPSSRVATGKTGGPERGYFYSFHLGRGMSVFDLLVQLGRASNFQDARQQVAELSGVPMPKTSPKKKPESPAPAPTAQHPSNPPTSSSTRLAIQVDNRQFKDLMEETWRVIHALNRPPTLFRRVGGLAMIKLEDDHGACIDQMTVDDVFGYLARLCDWERSGEMDLIPTNPPMVLARDLLAYPNPQLPRLEAITRVPVFDKKGTLIASHGYHPEERVWFEPDPTLHLDPIPPQPTPQEIDAAKSLLLDDLLYDFPFASDADKANYLAALLLPFMRNMIFTPTPLHVIEAPSIGSGKSLLCHLICLILTGEQGNISTFPVDENERQKRITSELLFGRPVVLLDNASEKLKIDSSHLAGVLTSTKWSDRILGQSKMINLPNRAVWLLTGNNPQLSMEIARRSVRIRLAPRNTQPWRRTEFKHPALLVWVQENRDRLLHAVLTLIQNWISQGKPRGGINLGSYEDWAGCLGGILEAAGIPGFLGNLDSLYEDADGEGGMWAEFTQAWWEAFGAAPKKVTDLNDLCEEKNLLGVVRRDGSPRSQEIRLGFALARKKDCPCGDFTITPVRKQGKRKSGQEYALLKYQETPPPPRRPGLDFDSDGTSESSHNGEGDGPSSIQRNQNAPSQSSDEKLTPSADERTAPPENGVVGGCSWGSLSQTSPAKNPSKNAFYEESGDVGVVAPNPSRENPEKRDTTHAYTPCIEEGGSNYPNIPQGGPESAIESITTGTFENGVVGSQHPHQHPQLPHPEKSAPPPVTLDLNDPSLEEEDALDGSRAPPEPR